MKIIDLLNAQPIIQQIIDRKMPFKLAYGLAKNFRLITTELEDYNKARLKILQDNWILDPKTNRFDIPDKDQSRWTEMHDELVNTESTYEPYKIDIALTENAEWSPGELMALWFIFQGEGSSDLAPISKKVEL